MPNEIPALPPVSVDDLLKMIGDLTVTVARLNALVASYRADRAESADTE